MLGSAHVKLDVWTGPKDLAQKFHTDDASLSRSGYRSDWPLQREILSQPTRGTTQIRVVTWLWNQYGISAVVPRADVITRGNQWWRREISTVFSGWFFKYDFWQSTMIHVDSIKYKANLLNHAIQKLYRTSQNIRDITKTQIPKS